MLKLPTYTFPEHLHRYAVWTAARAAQRGFTTTENINQAVAQAGLRQKLEALARAGDISIAQFDAFHRAIANQLIDALSPAVSPVSYGRVAKIMAIYIKTSQVIPDPAAAISQVAHPPIDRILLQNLASHAGPSFKYLSKITWTTLDELTYFKLINDLRTLLQGRPFWVLEAYWVVG